MKTTDKTPSVHKYPQAIRVFPGHRFISRQDGTPFFWLADTWWYAATARMSDVMVETLVADRAAKGFTVILLVIGAPPEVDPLSQEARGHGGLAFQSDGTINASYFDSADLVIRKILSAGMVPCIVGSWGNHIDRFGVDGMKRLWKEILLRYGRLPVAYCLTGEADISLSGETSAILHTKSKNLAKDLNILGYTKILRVAATFLKKMVTRLSKNNTAALESRIAKWNTVAEYIVTLNTEKRPLLVHPHRKIRARTLFHNPAWLSVDSVQSGHTKNNADFLVSSALDAFAESIPYINLEPWYEGILGNFCVKDQRYAFWMSVLSGACGHTYGAHGIWQLSDNDNFMGHWGISDWKSAMNYEGSGQLGKATKFLSDYPWHTFTPKPELISPSWTPQHVNRPVAALDTDSRTWIYIPADTAQHTYTALGEKDNTYTVINIDPSTMKQLSIISIRSTPYTIQTEADTDQLILMIPMEKK